MSVTVRCDQCDKLFSPEIKERPLPGGSAQQRFRCPHCRHWYEVATITALGLRIRQRMATAKGHELPALRALMAKEVRGPKERRRR